MIDKFKSDSGLMGPTHALSALAIALLFAWLADDIMFDTFLGSRDMIVFISAVIIIIGSSLMPDLDAVNSTSINTLGIVGAVMSTGMRAFSSIVQGLIKGPSDKSQDPHRGFWHTFLSAIIVGALIATITSINATIFKVGEVEVTVAAFVVVFIIYISMQLTMASLAKSFYKGKGSSIPAKMGAVIISILLLVTLPKDLSYNWVGVAVAFGWTAHLLGDMMTVSGIPFLFPIKIKGKRWWNIRMPFAIKANGFVENTFLIPIFSVVVVISLYNVISLLN